MSRFCIGEAVIGLPQANDRYIVTREGWIGIVVDILDMNMIQVKGIGEINVYAVFAKYFTSLHCFPQDTVLSYEERV
jgi:hypothetical protein